MTQTTHRPWRTRTIGAFLIAGLATMTAGCGNDEPTADTVTLVTYSSFPVADTMVNAATASSTCIIFIASRAESLAHKR